MTLQREAERQSNLAQAVLSGTLFDNPDQCLSDALASVAWKYGRAIQIKMIRADMVKEAPNDCLLITGDESTPIRQFAQDDLGGFVMCTGLRI